MSWKITSYNVCYTKLLREGHRHGIQRVVKGGEKKVIGHTVELEGLHKDGYTFPVELSLSTWSTAEGAHFCGIIRDITERKKNEQALRKSQEKLTKQADKLRAANKHRITSYNVCYTKLLRPIVGLRNEEVFSIHA